MERAGVLIAGFSGRALAQSAHRAGFKPYVADCFGDEDTIAIADTAEILLRDGLLLGVPRALSALARLAPPGSLQGLVLSAGFEADPELIADLSKHYTLLGCAAETTAGLKDPDRFFPVLAQLGIAHPETRREPPVTLDGWLVKRSGGAGGLHVKPAVAADHEAGPHDAAIYYQRLVPGRSISVLGVVSPVSVAFAFSEQWTAPAPRAPYRYGGAVGSIALEPDIEGRLLDAALDVSRAFNLIGLVSFDFLVDGEDVHLIEVNARPGATLDVFDDASGTMFKAHIAACTPGGDPAELMAREWRPPLARACAYLYADRSRLVIPSVAWPEWTADRPQAGTRIARHQPIATAFADANSPEEAMALVKSRLAEIEELLYENHHFEKEQHG